MEKESKVLFETPHADTLSDLEDIDQYTNISTLLSVLFGEIYDQPGRVGTLTFGTTSMMWHQHQIALWGIPFEADYNTIYVRSFPTGRIGMPLGANEVRITQILNISNATPENARLSIIYQYLRRPLVNDVLTKPQSPLYTFEQDGQKLTYSGQRPTLGAHGVNMMGIHLMEHCGCLFEPGGPFRKGRYRFHVVLGSSISLTNVINGSKTMTAVVAGMGNMAIAGSLAGTVMPDAVRNSIQEVSNQAWEDTRRALCKGLNEKVLQRDLAMKERLKATQEVLSQFGCADADATATTASTESEAERGFRCKQVTYECLFEAERIAESMSFVGLLDMMAHPFNHGCLPDAMHMPDGLSMLMCFAVRIACYPNRYKEENVMVGTLDDQFATNEFNRLFEDSAPRVHDLGDDDSVWAIDIPLMQAVSTVRTEIGAYKQQAKSTRSTKEKKYLQKQADDAELLLSHTLNLLYRAGVAVCIDVCRSMTPREAKACKTPYGFAYKCFNHVMHSRAEAHWAQKIGSDRHFDDEVSPIRNTSVNQRLSTLLKRMIQLDHFLVSGSYGNTQLSVITDPKNNSVVVPASPLAAVVTAISMATGQIVSAHLPQESISPTVQKPFKKFPTTPEAFASEELERRRTEAAAKVIEQVVSDASNSGTKSSKKSSKKTQSKTISAMEAVKKTMKEQANSAESSLIDEKTAERVFEKINAPASSACALHLATVLRSGISALNILDLSTFLISNNSAIQCCNCQDTVDPIQGFALTVENGCSRCTKCMHPRCLACASEAADRMSCIQPIAPRSCLFCEESQTDNGEEQEPERTPPPERELSVRNVASVLLDEF